MYKIFFLCIFLFLEEYYIGGTIKLENICLNYGKKEIFKNLNFEIEDGKYYCVIGKNGAGKSSLAKLIVSINKPDSGVISNHKKFGYVFQNPSNQFVCEKVINELAFGMENLCFDKKRMSQNIKLYSKMLEIDDLLDKKISELSGGQQQRVAICSIFCMEIKYLILDEVTSMLDPKSTKIFIENLCKLHKENNLTIISITHNLDECLVCDKVLVIDELKVLYNDEPHSIFTNTNYKLMKPMLYQIMDKLHVNFNVKSYDELVECLCN